MDALKSNQIRVHLKGGENYVAPLIAKDGIVRLLTNKIEKIEHWKAPPIVAATPAKPDMTWAKKKIYKYLDNLGKKYDVKDTKETLLNLL